MTPIEAGVGKIGPNAITRTTEATRALYGEADTARLLHAAGLGGYLGAPPTRMVDECEVVALHGAMRDLFGPVGARRVARAAGERTADYLLANRIPLAAQYLLRALPKGPSSRLLLRAIGSHAWTFAGTGHFSATAGHPTRLGIAGCPICRGARADAPACDYYAATFERLFRVLINARASVIETECAALGASDCVFTIRWRDRPDGDGAG